jgi:hypothetical protein
MRNNREDENKEGGICDSQAAAAAAPTGRETLTSFSSTQPAFNGGHKIVTHKLEPS